MLMLPRRCIACPALRLRAVSLPQIEGGSRPSRRCRAGALYAMRSSCVHLVPQIEGGRQAAAAAPTHRFPCAQPARATPLMSLRLSGAAS